MAFCRWLSERTGREFTLPSEAQWEYACRAGAASAMSYGAVESDFSPFANLADVALQKFASDPNTLHKPLSAYTKYDDWIPRNVRYDDGALVTAEVGGYRPNAWGLKDMHGNVAEWTRTSYKPYPYNPRDGRDNGSAGEKKVVRGGSWYDRPHRARSAFRLNYEPWQPVFNVGFRVVLED